MSKEVLIPKDGPAQPLLLDPNFDPDAKVPRETDKLLDNTVRSTQVQGQIDGDNDYIQFIKKHGSKWKAFNIMAGLMFLGIAGGTIAIQKANQEDCGGIKTALWLSMACNVMNAGVNFMCALQIEQKACSSFGWTVFIVF